MYYLGKRDLCSKLGIVLLCRHVNSVCVHLIEVIAGRQTGVVASTEASEQGFYLEDKNELETNPVPPGFVEYRCKCSRLLNCV